MQFQTIVQSLNLDSKLPHKKMKTMFLSNMSKSRRLTSTFFPIKTFMYLLHFKSLKTWAKWAKWARILKNTLTDEQLCNTDICMLKQTKVHSFIDPTWNLKKIEKIQFRFFAKKSLKNHNLKNICPRDFCLAPNERELSNLLTLSISLEAPISRMR